MSKKILVIEDDASIRESIADLLKFEYFEVHTAANGIEGLEQIRKWHPDLVISDIRMPGMNGFEMLKKYIHDPEYTEVPFIFLSALAEKEDVKTGMNLGADDYLTKPFTQAELLSAVRTHLAQNLKARYL